MGLGTDPPSRTLTTELGRPCAEGRLLQMPSSEDSQVGDGASPITPVVGRFSTSIRSADPGVGPRVAGKFLYVGDKKLWIRGATYGTFRPGSSGAEFHDQETVERDFTDMAANGFNAVRVYTVPPRWLLDAAKRHGLWVIVGVPWEQHIT